jgi:hypothetical protein
MAPTDAAGEQFCLQFSRGEAQERCKSIGGTLAIIRSKDDQDRLAQFMIDHCFGITRAWLGAHQDGYDDLYWHEFDDNHELPSQVGPNTPGTGVLRLVHKPNNDNPSAWSAWGNGEPALSSIDPPGPKNFVYFDRLADRKGENNGDGAWFGWLGVRTDHTGDIAGICEGFETGPSPPPPSPP